MKKQLVLLLCMLSGYVTYAQQNVNALEFVKQAPWNLTKPEIDLKYKDYEVELADSIKTSISDSYAAIGDKIFGGFQFGKYDAYTCYVTHENTNKPHMFIIFVDPAQTIDADKRVLTYYTDSLLYANLGEPSYKQEDTINEKGDSVAVRFWEQQNTMLISTVAQYNSQPDKPLFFFITMINPDDGSSDFRVARWGDSMAEIIEREGRINEWEGQMINPNVYSFGSSIANKLCKVLYFFTSNDTPVKPDNMSEKAFTDLIASLTEIRSNIEARGERFLTNNIVLFQKYADGTRVAGEVDILSVDADGNFRIYDVKTSRYSFYDFTDRYGHRVNYFTSPSATQRMSAKDYYTLQLSAYKNLFESQYHTPITTLAVLPFVLNYNKDVVDGVTKEKGIMITYNPAVNVPLVGAVKASEPTPTNSTVPVFNSALETQDPVNNVLPEYSLEDSKVGYFVRDGKLHKSYLTPIGKVNGVDVYMAKIPTITKGFGRQGEEAHVASNSYMAVFPNGNSITLIKNDPMTMTEQQAKDTIKKMLNGNPQRVVDMSNEKTLIFDPSSAPIVEAPKTETPATILSTPTESGAAKAAQAEQAVNENDDEFEDDLDLGSLRRVDDETRGTWNQEKELAWIKKVLPQLSDNDRVRVIKGLIRVGNQGALAWGQFNNGIITLSDVAAEGTTYHEAFHAVFNLLLDNNERQALYDEARKLYGDKSDLDLEEDMAEGFREYVMTRESRGIGGKILDFFKDLFAKVTNWSEFRPHLISYYRMINQGKYSNSTLKVSTISELRRYRRYEITLDDNPFAKDASIDNGTFNPDNVDFSGYRPEFVFRVGREYIGSFHFEDLIRTGDSETLKDNDYLTFPEVGWGLSIEPEFRGKGLGKAMYFEAAKYAFKKGRTLRSASIGNVSKEALRVWESFVRLGYANIRGNHYVFNNAIFANNITTSFDSLDNTIRENLIKKGWTAEKFDSISQEERDQAVKCIAL